MQGRPVASHVRPLTRNRSHSTFLESSLRNVSTSRKRHPARPHIVITTPFQDRPIRGTTQTTNSDIARGIPAWYDSLLVQVCLQPFCPKHQPAGKAGATWGLSPLPSVTTRSASCHRRFCLLFFYRWKKKERTNPVHINIATTARVPLRIELFKVIITPSP
jgi:hypothetical protein